MMTTTRMVVPLEELHPTATQALVGAIYPSMVPTPSRLA